MEVNTDLLQHISHTGVYQETACSADTASLYSISRCLWAGRTAFCDEVVIAESTVYGKVLFLDKEIQSAESDEAIYHEHLVHPALNALAHIPSKRVLIVGGGEGATAREVLKWSAESVATVDWVDIDGGLVDLCRRHLSWADDPVYNDPRIHYYAQDIRLFWASNTVKYDLIILDLPDPDLDGGALQIATEGGTDYGLYGGQFFNTLRDQLSPHGAFVSHCGPIAPGGDPVETRGGLDWISRAATIMGFQGASYHTCIPSFQSEWGFYMSVPPVPISHFPEGLAVMDADAQAYAFTWPRFWTSPYIGFGRAT